IFVSNELIESDPELVERFRRASLKGWKYALDNPQEIIEYIPTIITKNKEIQSEIITFNKFQAEKVLEYTLYPVVDLGNINPHRWNTMNDTLVKLSLINTSKDSDEYIFNYQKIIDLKEAKTDQSFLTFLVFSFITILLAFLVHLSTKNTLLENEITLNQKAQVKILRSKERYQAIFNSAVLGITMTSKDGNILQSNDMWQKMIGYCDDELHTMNINDLMLPEDKKNSNELMRKLTLGEIDNYVEEKRYFKKDGTFFWGKLFMTSIYDQDVDRKVNIGMILDITNVKIEEDTVKRSEERFRNIISDVATEIDDSRNLSYDGANVFDSKDDKNKLSLKLEKINLELERMFKNELDENRKKGAILIYQARLAAMGEMIGNIAHQWRQPLNNLGLILGNMEDAYNYNELDKDYMEKSIDKSMKLIKKMSTTIDDFRYFLNPRTEKSYFEVRATILDVFELLEENLRFNRINVDIDVHDEDTNSKLSGYGYENQFSQAIFNIITNSVDALVASEFSENFIKVDIYDLGDNINIEIRDSGGGISEDIIENVFELYFTTKEMTKGTGLGLYITKTIIENNLDGYIRLENTTNGLKTIISIPR
ncbi:MAG: PAS domain S-box protein, partial [Acidaminobacteraceae bacterium]